MGHSYWDFWVPPPTPEQLEADRSEHRFREEFLARAYDTSNRMINGKPSATYLARMALFLQMNSSQHDNCAWYEPTNRLWADDEDGICLDSYDDVNKYYEKHAFKVNYTVEAPQSDAKTRTLIERKTTTAPLKKLHSPIPLLHLVAPDAHILGDSSHLLRTWLDTYGMQPYREPKEILVGDDASITHMAPHMEAREFVVDTIVKISGEEFLVSPSGSSNRKNYRVVQVS